MTSLAAIHTGKKALGLDDDTYRAMLARITGKQSAAVLSEKEREKVIEEMRRQGFRKALKPSQKVLEGRFAKKLQALWISAYNLGLISDRRDKALLAFVKRQTGIDHTRFLHNADDAFKVIEALKAWLSRAGGVDWKGCKNNDYTDLSGFRIAAAQWCLLYKNDLEQLRSFTTFVTSKINKPLSQSSEEDFIMIMNVLGKEIRKAMNDGRL